MSSQDIILNMNENNILLNGDDKSETSEHIISYIKDIKHERNDDEFESDPDNVSIAIKNGDENSISSQSIFVEENDNSKINEGGDNLLVPMNTEFGLLIDAEITNVDEQLSNNASCMIDKIQVEVGVEENVSSDVTIPRALLDETHQVATSTIVSRDVCEQDDISSKSLERVSEFQIFSDQLNKLSATIQHKDEEIKKLSQKLFELENKERKSQNLSDRSYFTSSSSSDESVTLMESVKEKKRKKIEVKSVDKLKGTKENNVKDREIHEEIHGQQQEEVKESCVTKTEELASIVKKLDALESEVKRLQQANIDSVLSLQLIQNSTPQETPSKDSIINQLLVDHSLLKEELDQLRWDHSKLAEPGILGEEIKQLKVEVCALRNQNELIHQYIKPSSTKSLNNLVHHTASRASSEDFHDKFLESQPHDRLAFIGNNRSDYIYERLHSKRRGNLETPSVSTMLKRSIESLESPYQNTCQSMKHEAQMSGGETFRARRLSDSTTALIEDTSPKTWLEPVSKDYEPAYDRYSHNQEAAHVKRDHEEFDQRSVDSLVTVTTSVTETGEDDQRYSSKTSPFLRQNYFHQMTVAQQTNADLLSSVDTDTLADSTDRGDYKRKPRHTYSFTPKSATDLNLEDLVKFARPGGKMSTGRVCFVGHLPGRGEICVGLELDEDAGKHDGMFEGVRYFQCRRNRGVFISFHKIILAYKSI